MRKRRLLMLAGAAAAAHLLVERRDRRAVARDPVAGHLLDTASHPRGVEQQVTSADGTVLHVTTYGPEGAPVVVLVHGWMCRSDYWLPQITALADDLRLVTYDLRGHGRSRVGRGASLEADDLADDLAAVLETTVPAGQRAVVVGHSMGAMSTVAWAGRHPEQVEQKVAAVLLADTGVADLTASAALAGPLDGSTLLRAVVGKVVFRSPLPYPPTPVTRRIVRHISLSRTATPAQVRLCERMILAAPPRPRAGWGAMMHRLDLRDALAHLTVPTTVMVGSRDRLTPPPLSRALADALPNLAGFEEVPGAGHMATVEEPEVFNDKIRELVAKHLAVPV